MKYEYKKLSKDKNKTEIEITVAFSEFDFYKNEAYKELAEGVVIPGFRPGKGPKESIEAKLGEKLINEAISKMLPVPAIEILTKEDIRPISRVNYELNKFDLQDGIVYKISFTEYPEVKLGDLSKIKVERKVEETSQKDVDSVIKNIVRSSLKPEVLKKYEIKNNVGAGYKPAPAAENVKSNSKSDKKDTEDEQDPKSKIENRKSEIDIDFELTDDLIKELKYEKEKTVADMRDQVKKKLQDIKEKQSEDSYLEDLLSEAVKAAVVDLPDVLIENETQFLEEDFNSRLKELKLDPELFLKTQGTTLDEKRKEWKLSAESKIKTELVLYQVAVEHKLEVTEADVNAEIESIKDPKIKSSYSNEDAKSYIRSVLTKRKAVEKLKELTKSK